MKQKLDKVLMGVEAIIYVVLIIGILLSIGIMNMQKFVAGKSF